MMNAIHKKFIVIFLTLAIGSCGYQLRNNQGLSFKNISIEGKALNISKNFKNFLISNKIKIVSDSENPELRIELLNEESEKRILSLSGYGLVREYEFFYRIRYRFKTADSEIWSPENVIEIHRDLTYSDTTLLGKQIEEAQLYETMYSDAITNLFYQISFLKK